MSRMDVSRLDFDGVLILGAGLAGLSAALAAAPRRALVVTPEALGVGCSSAWAQGGVAVALAEDDTPALHAADTVAAGAGLVEAERAQLLTEEGPAAVMRLLEFGAPFDQDAGGQLVQSLEAAHSRARVARVGGDRAGAAIMAAMAKAAQGSPLIDIWTGARARRLLQDVDGRVRGALIDKDGQLIEVAASATVLATGGLGGLYAKTTVPAAVRGEGLGLAALAGAVIADPEFVQFHPTAMDLGLDPAPLATEALRGEGAILVDRQGRRFMLGVDPRAELAPRDVVARAIFRQHQSGEGAFLDARAAVGEHFPEAFPAVFAACMAAGVDPRRQPIPVAAACHYHMGGVETEAEGRTSLAGLYAAGECASTGVHGANRLASNSLLEAAVFGARAGRAASEDARYDAALLPAAPAPDLPDEVLQALREAMTDEAGLIRDAEGLERLLSQIEAWREAYGEAPPLIAAELVAAAAWRRCESRGAHWRRDYPQTLAPRRTRLTLADAEAILAELKQRAAA